MTPTPHRMPTTAYVDGSAILAVAFEEPAGPETARRLDGFSRLYSSNLLVAELQAAYARERRPFDTDWLSRILLIYPNRSLYGEIATALQIRYLRSADLLHIATAMYAVSNYGIEPAFITLDNAQREVAAGLGFVT